MTFGLREESAGEKANALNSRIPNAEKVAGVPELAVRAFAKSTIRATLAADRPMTAIRNEPVAT